MIAQHQTEAAEQPDDDELDDDMGVQEQPDERHVVRGLHCRDGIGRIHALVLDPRGPPDARPARTAARLEAAPLPCCLLLARKSVETKGFASA